ncbi:hypothetical protein MUP95_02975 [bacterium]|nr:hypothetical protein [bacterium]
MAPRGIIEENYQEKIDWGEKDHQREKRRLQGEKKKRQKIVRYKSRHNMKYSNSKYIIYGEDDDFEYDDM